MQVSFSCLDYPDVANQPANGRAMRIACLIRAMKDLCDAYS